MNEFGNSFLFTGWPVNN